MCAQPPFIVPDKLFRGQPAHALHEAAFHLTNINDTVQRTARIVKNIGALHHIFASQCIDRNFRTGCTISVIIEGVAFTLCAIPMDFRRFVMTRC